MKTLECIHCETFFDCKGKATNEPCVQFVENKEYPKPSFEDVLQKEMVKNNGDK